ncbi:hypothetical protein DM01DRAFT_1410554 [Hesseltinella vesiculosa]|uniref:RING-type E3 ubiquitin transferase n=1 Tax=Hesseltinella vesiculosa TaxID=101127 RepID=A0A1X2G6P0_9FUNG|nr:hypothetical protein DM01DRAFT_1410554 [Hesseltinella vesiculosa]
MSGTQQQPSGNTRYFCHACGREVQVYMAPDLTCQVCNEQFIEEIDDNNDDPRTFSQTANFQSDDGDAAGEDDIFQFFRGALGNNAPGTTTRFQFSTTDDLDANNANGGSMGAMLQNIFSNILSGNAPNNGTDPNHSQPQQGQDHPTDTGEQPQNQRRTPVIIYSGTMDSNNNMQFTPVNLRGDQPPQQNDGSGFHFHIETNGNDTNADGTNTDTQNGRNDLGNSFQGILQLLSAITGTNMDAGFVGNPNDYAFSQTALDNIITQLMEQTAGRSAPPPAPEDVIDKLPSRQLKEEEFKEQLDCAVCKDEFNQSEMVIELPCQHVFHDDCIKPWLKMNGTCPVCRHAVGPNLEPETNSHTPDHSNESSSSQTDGNAVPQGEQTVTTDPRSPTQEHRPQSTPTPAYSWFSGMRSGATTPASWPTSIPGTFTWGPGGGNTNLHHGRSSTSNSSQQNHSEDDHDDAPSMDLDLD